MSERPTPETDALISVGLENADRECVNSEFARKLERERDEARADLQFRRELYKLLEVANNHLMTANEEVAKLARTLKQERDEAREELEEEKKFHHRTHSELIQTQCRLMDVTQAIIATLEENRNLSDGEDCTLAKLKSVVPDWK